MSTLPLHSMGGLLKSEIELLVIHKAEEMQQGFETMLSEKLAENKVALDGRLDLQDANVGEIKEIALDSNKIMRELCDKHENWHDADVIFRENVKNDIRTLKAQVKAIRVLVTLFSGVVRASKYIIEHGDKATGLTLKLILALVVYLTGQSLYFRWLQHFLQIWFAKGH